MAVDSSSSFLVESLEFSMCTIPCHLQIKNILLYEYTLIQRDILMANRYMKRCSPSLVIRAMQITNTMSNHLTHVRIAIINKPKNYKYQ